MRVSNKIFASSLGTNAVGCMVYVGVLSVIYGQFLATRTAMLTAMGLVFIVFVPLALALRFAARPLDALERGGAQNVALIDAAHYRVSLHGILTQNVAIFFAFLIAFSAMEGDALLFLKLDFWRELLVLQSVFMITGIVHTGAVDLIVAHARDRGGISSYSGGKRFTIGAKICVTGISLVLSAVAYVTAIGQISVLELYKDMKIASTRVSYRSLPDREAKIAAMRGMVDNTDALIAEVKAYNDALRTEIEADATSPLSDDYVKNFFNEKIAPSPLVELLERKSDAVVRRSFIYLAFLLPTALGVLSMFAYSLAYRFRSLRRRTAELAAGGKDLVVRLSVTGLDDIGSIADDFNRILDVRAKETVEIRDATGHANESWSTLRDSVRDVVQRVSRLTAAADEARSRANDQRSLTADAGNGVNSLREAGRDLDETVLRLNTVIDELSKFLMDTLQTVSAVRDSSNKNSGILSKLGEDSRRGVKAVTASGESLEEIRMASRKVGELVGAVADVAERTNLLAMNASIEAAHAGSAGRGFAVVAHEIRSLAASASSIAAQVAERNRAMEETINRGVTLSREVAETFKTIQDGTAGAESATAIISGAMDGQDERTGQTQRAIRELAESSGKVRELAELQLSRSEDLGRFTETVVESSQAAYGAADEQSRLASEIAAAAKGMEEAAAVAARLVGEVKELADSYKLEG